MQYIDIDSHLTVAHREAVASLDAEYVAIASLSVQRKSRAYRPGAGLQRQLRLFRHQVKPVQRIAWKMEKKKVTLVIYSVESV